MKILSLIFLPTILAFNLNNLSRKEVISSLSLSFFSIFKKYDKDLISSSNINDKIMDDQNQESMIIETYKNNIFFYSEINKISAFELEKSLLLLNEKLEDEPINLHIQSNGGSVFHTIYLIDLIQNIDCPIHTYIDGYAASSATLLSISGQKRYMTKNSQMLIHQLSAGTKGKYSEIKDENENLDNLMNFIINQYLINTKLDKNILEDLLKRDIWLDSSTCLLYGLIDKIL